MLDVAEDVEKDDEIVSLCLGYVPKDLAYNLSTVLDNPHVLNVTFVSYFQAQSRLTVEFELSPKVLRD